MKEADGNISEEKHRAGWREALIAIVVPIGVILIYIFTVRKIDIGINASPLPYVVSAFLDDFEAFLGFVGPSILSFAIFYRFSKNFKKSLIIGIAELIIWLAIFIILLTIFYAGMH